MLNVIMVVVGLILIGVGIFIIKNSSKWAKLLSQKLEEKTNERS